jgi:alcohol dehydrogenase class IV
VKAFRYASPTELMYGPGSRRRVGSEVAQLGGSRALIVTDRGLAGVGVADELATYVADGVELVGVWTDVPQDPTFADVEALVAKIRTDRVDTVISLGSGSVMAAGRSAGVCAPDERSVRAIAKAGPVGTPLLNVCIPTTAGSGGEVSRQATLTDDESGEKSGVRGWQAAARLAVLDPELLVSVPRAQAVASGIDAMLHALEAYWSRRATILTDSLARPSFSVLFTKLVESIETRDVAVLGEMLVASTIANLACGNAGLGLVHGLNKGVTGLAHKQGYETVPYGMLHAILLPWVVDFNIPVAAAKLATLARDVGVARDDDDDTSAAVALNAAIAGWLLELDAPRVLPWPKCTDDDIDFIVKDTAGRAMWQDNARTATEEELADLVRKSLTDWSVIDWSTTR